MRPLFSLLLLSYISAFQLFAANKGNAEGKSIYQSRLNDAAATYFEAPQFNITSDGKTDVSDALQEAILTLKSNRDCGVLFIPEGTYLITKTIYVPTGIRLIGYGKNRPLMVLGNNSPGYQQQDPSKKAGYMFWFVNSYNPETKQISDANASTFYSALSNINLKIADGNPGAVAIRSHYAQHSFISHADIYTGNGMAGIHEVGNELEDVRFFGGEYGIIATKTSPGWQYVMVDTYFDGQRKAAIQTQEAGLTIIRMNVKNVPVVIDTNPDKIEKLYMQDCQLENISTSVLIVGNERNANNQISVRNTSCRKAPVFAIYRQSGKKLEGLGPVYHVKQLISGLQMDSLKAEPVLKTTYDAVLLKDFPGAAPSDIPPFQATDTWVNIKSLGAKGDGKTDDFPIIREAVEKYQTIYFPDGWYLVSETVKLKSNTALIGLHPVTTQLMLANNTPAFAGFGGPKPLLESSVGGTNIISGIGLNTNLDNPRAVGCKWMAGPNSYMNDVKFIGGHGGMMNSPQGIVRERTDRSPRGMAGDESKWDSQYWSLWITNGGGGTFKDIWTAHTVASSGLLIDNTKTKGQVYLLSAEHHVRNEIRLKNVSNWQIHAIQLEEEGWESRDCLPLEIEECSKLLFTNLFMYRVTRVTNPLPYGFRTWNSKEVEFLNLHNNSQLKFAFDNSLFDMNTQTEVRSREFTRLHIKSSPASNTAENTNQVQKLATGFEFANGLCRDSKGNVFFCDSRLKRIFKWSAENNTVSMITDIQWEPLSLGFDKNDNLLVVFKYYPRKGYPFTGLPEPVGDKEEAGDSFGGWGITPFGVLAYSMDPNNPINTIRLLEKKSIKAVDKIHKVLFPVYRQRFNPLPGDLKACFVAPDGETIIPLCNEMSRSCAMVEAFPGLPFFSVDDAEKRTVKCTMDTHGNLTEALPFAEMGEFGLAKGKNGTLCVAAGEIYLFDAKGQRTGQIKVPERPTNICFGGKEGNTLFIAAGTSLYGVEINQTK